jgi:hypothetical protein
MMLRTICCVNHRASVFALNLNNFRFRGDNFPGGGASDFGLCAEFTTCGIACGIIIDLSAVHSARDCACGARVRTDGLSGAPPR